MSTTRAVIGSLVSGVAGVTALAGMTYMIADRREASGVTAIFGPASALVGVASYWA